METMVTLNPNQATYLLELVHTDLNRMRQLTEHAKSRGERNFALSAVGVAQEVGTRLLPAANPTKSIADEIAAGVVGAEMKELREFVFDVAGNLASQADYTALITRGNELMQRWELANTPAANSMKVVASEIAAGMVGAELKELREFVMEMATAAHPADPQFSGPLFQKALILGTRWQLENVSANTTK
jgi:hypothetical protein